MPKLKHCTASLSEVLQVRDKPLEEHEIWSILTKSTMTIQDLYISGSHSNSITLESFDQVLPMITPETILVDQHGSITFGSVKSFEDHCNFIAPEMKLLNSFNDAQVEKMLIYSLGKTLRHASLYKHEDYDCLLSNELPVQNHLSATLNETLNFMHLEDCTFRHSLASLFEIIFQYARVGSQMRPFSLIVMHLYEEILGTSIELSNVIGDIDEDYESLFYENNVRDLCENEKQTPSKGEIDNIIDIEKVSGNETNENPTNIESNDDDILLGECHCNQTDKIVDENNVCGNHEEQQNTPSIDRNLTDQNNGNEIANQLKVQKDYNDQVESEEGKLQFPDMQFIISNKVKLSNEDFSTDQQCTQGPEFVIRRQHPVINLSVVDLEHDLEATQTISVISLTGQRFSLEIDAESTKNGDIFHAVAAHEKLKERFLFGLAYKRGDEFIFVDLESNFNKMSQKINQHQNDLFNLETFTFYLRLKFYISNTTINDSIAIKLHYLQLRKDILEERISCPLQTAILLASLALQVEFRDVNLDNCNDFQLKHYLPRWIIQRHESESIRLELIRLHGSGDPISSTETTRSDFTKHVQGLRDHGFHFHVVQRDKKDLKTAILLGVSLAGISIFAPLDTDQGENKQELQRYSWQQITKITYDKRHFYLTLQSRNLKNHFRKCRFHTRDHLGQYLFNLSYAHHRLHLRLTLRLDDSQRLGFLNGKDGLLVSDDNPGDILVSNNEENNIQTNVTKPRRSKTFRDLNILKLKRKTISEVPVLNNQISKSNKATRKSSLLTSLFHKRHLSLPKGSHTGTQTYVIDTSIRSHKSDSPVLKADEVISTSLNERFANLSGLEQIERRIADVILVRDESGSLGITVCQGADGATYIQSVDYIHHGSDIRPGDRIMAINGRYVETMSYSMVVELLKNLRTLVNLTISQTLDQLDDDVFEQQQQQHPISGVITSEMTNGSHVDVTYECHDVDLRNEIKSMCFVQDKIIDQMTSDKYKDLNGFSDNSVLPDGVCTIQQSVSHLETNSLSSTLSSPELEGCNEVMRELPPDGELSRQSSLENCINGKVPLKTSLSVSEQSNDLDGILETVTMVTKPNPSEENSAEFHQFNNGDSATNNLAKTVLWNPRHSGTVRNKVSSFEEQSQKSVHDLQKPLPSPSHKTRLFGNFPFAAENVPKSMSLHKFSSIDYDDVHNRSEKPLPSGAWCFAVTGRPYPNKRLPELARSKTMPTVCREHVDSDLDSPTSNEPLSPIKPSLKQNNAPWWSPRQNHHQEIDDDFAPTLLPQKSQSHFKKTSSDLILAPPPPPRSNRHSDFFHDKSFAFEGLPNLKTQLSLSTDDVTRSPSLVAIAKEKLRKQSTLPEVPYFLAKSSTTDNILHTLNKQIDNDTTPKTRPKTTKNDLKQISLFDDVRIRQLQSWLPFVNENMVFEVKIQKNSRGLGLSVCGGKDQYQDDPYSQLVRIKRLYPLHPASETGLLKVGDLLLMVNGQHLTGLNQNEVLDALRVASGSIDLIVCRPPPGSLPPVPQTGGLINSSALSLSSMNLLGLAGEPIIETPSDNQKEFEIVMEKWAGSLGFTLQRCEHPLPGHYVKALVKDPALSDGRLQPGDQILQVNGTNISTLSKEEAIGLLRSASNTVKLLVSRGAKTPVLSPLSPLSSMFAVEDLRSRSDKKVLRKEARDLLFDKEMRRSQDSGRSGSSVSPVNRRYLRKDRSPSNRTDSDAAETLSNASDLDCHADLSGAIQPPAILKRSESLLKVPRPSFLSLSGSSSSDSPPLPSSAVTPSFCVSTWNTNDIYTSPVDMSQQTPEARLKKWQANAKLIQMDDFVPHVLEQTWPMSMTVEFDRNENSRLGFSLIGVENGNLKGTYIKSIHPDSLVAQDGRLKQGDNLIKVNGIVIKDFATNTVIEMLRTIRGKITLDVLRDPVVSSKILANSSVTRSSSLIRKTF